MGATLPVLSFGVFSDRLAPFASEPLSPGTEERLFAHYEELRRWNPRLSLIGPGDMELVVERHYGESLAALPFIPPGPANLVDVGSGAGFPGLVLAAARPDLAVTLVEVRERKWAFLEAAVRRASLSTRCLNARVALPLPPGLPDVIELVTSRALSLAGVLAPLAGRTPPGGRVLLWLGGQHPPELPDFQQFGETLLGGKQRRIVGLQRVLQEGPRKGSA